MRSAAKLEPQSILRRAVTVFKAQDFDEEKRELNGIATTPTVDRMGDVVESSGARFRLPLPLLWQHDHAQPVGEVYAAKAGKDGIAIKARIYRAVQSENLKRRFDEAWESIKLGAVRGLSIGFQPANDSPPVLRSADGIQGFHYPAWDWLELSLVTIPANADASITAIKSIDEALRAAPGRKQFAVVNLNPAGVTAATQGREAKQVKIAEQMTQLEASRAAKVAALNTLNEKTQAEARTKDDAEREQFDTLSEEVEALDVEIADLRKLEKLNLAQAKEIAPASGKEPRAAARERTPYITVDRRLPKGTSFTRYVMALSRSRGNPYEASEFSKRWQDSTPEVTEVLKAAAAAGTTTDADWASKLIAYTTMTDEFLELLRPMTILGKFGTGGIPALRRVPFNVRMATQTAGGTYGWVGEGAAKPVGELTIGEATLRWAKAAGIIVVTDELMRFSSPSIEAIVRQDMLAGMAAFSDAQFVDPTVAEVSNVSPASITNGVTPIDATGNDAAALRTDIGTLWESMFAANQSLGQGVWIMSNQQAMRLSLLRNQFGTKEFPDLTPLGGTLEGFPVIASESVPSDTGGSMIIFVNAKDVMYADDGPVTIDASREASLQMDTAPDNPTTASTVLISLWQRNMVALRAERYMNWKKARDTAVGYINGATYGSLST